MELDKYKKAILDEYLYSNRNIFINATAGAGKTFMLLKLLEKTPFGKKVLFLAFNKSIVEELERKILGRAEVKTLHSKAYSILLKYMRARFRLSQWRDYVICKKYLVPSWNTDTKGINQRIFNISKLYSLIRMNLVDINNREEVESVCLRWDVDFDDHYYEDIKLFIYKVEEEMCNDGDKLDIDFTDQLYLTYKHISADLFPKYDVIFLDEAQDLNPLQRELVLRMLKPTGRLVTAGDFSQCIYFFMGSSTDSFKLLRDRPNTAVLPMKLTYRCAKNIVKVAQKYSENIECLDDAREGVVREGKLSEVMPGDYVLCRNNLPLVEVFIYLSQLGVRSTILGKDYRESLWALLLRAESGVRWVDMLEEKQNELKKKGINNYKSNESYIFLFERIAICKILISHYGSIRMALLVLEDIFTEGKEECVTLSTIHKSKGLEAKRVFILGFNELLPSKYATTDAQLEAERCLQFVAVTRAKDELIFIPYKERCYENANTEILY